MAGGIQEPFRFDFQADLLHSGSVSFGRFESESLSWEKRSSFSHNRYLEDVEKYSKPGSVTEMKAYFEAHFRRKALQKQSSATTQDGKEFQTVENDEELEIQKHVKENVEALCSENGYVSCHVTNSEHLELKETENVVLVKSEVHIKEAVNDKDGNSGKAASQRAFSSKIRSTSQTKQSKPKLKAHTKSAQAQRNISGEANRREIKGLLVKEKEKKSPRPASPIRHSGRNTKLEESSMSFPKAKAVPINKSIVKEYRSEKTMEAKSLPGKHQNVNRTKHTVTTQSRPHTNQNAAGFIFKGDQRAKRRKEEKRAIEMVQCQKSANFKATPMPSFYKASSRSSDQNKVISTSKTPSRITPYTNKYISNSNASLNLRPGSSTSLTNRTRPSEVPKSVHDKKKDSSSQKQKVPEQTTRPRARDTLRRSGPKVGYLALSVAS